MPNYTRPLPPSRVTGQAPEHGEGVAGDVNRLRDALLEVRSFLDSTTVSAEDATAAADDAAMAALGAAETAQDALGRVEAATRLAQVPLGPFGGARPVSARYGGLNRSLSDGVATGANAVSCHKATADAADLQVVYANWDLGGSSGKEAGPGNPVTVAMAVEYPAGQFHRVYWDGAEQVTIPDLQQAVSDPVTTVEVIPAGALFWVHTFVSVAQAGHKWTQPLRAGTSWGEGVAPYAAPWITGEGVVTGTTQTDRTMVAKADLTNPNGSMPGPLAVLARSARLAPAIVAIGDSLLSGISARGVDQTWITTALADRAGYVVLGRAGGRGNEMTGPVARHRLGLVSAGTAGLVQFGVNDLNESGATAASVKATLVRLWRLMRARVPRVAQTTIAPWTTSTDGWSTVEGQTPRPWEAERVEVNTWLRDGAPLDAAGVPLLSGATGETVRRIGHPDHPLTAVLDVAAGAESGPDSGRWRVPGTSGTGDVTAGSTAITNYTGTIQPGQRVTVPGFMNPLPVVSVGGGVLTVSAAPSVTRAGATLAGTFTHDGVHPSYGIDALVAPFLDLDPLLEV